MERSWVEAVAEAAQQKSMLIGREENLNIEKYVGTIEANNKKKEVFLCMQWRVQIRYGLHNSPEQSRAQHRKLGKSMKIKTVSAEEVIQKLKSMKIPKSTRLEDREMAKFRKQPLRRNSRLNSSFNRNKNQKMLVLLSTSRRSKRRIYRLSWELMDCRVLFQAKSKTLIKIC